MSLVPGASPITTDIEEIRRRTQEDDRPLAGDDREAIPEPAPGEEADETGEASQKRPR